MASEATLRIGEVAERARISASAIRFYERCGLLPEPERVAGQRRYTTDVVRRLRVIETAKRAGLSLREIRALLDSTDQGSPVHWPLGALAARKLPEVDAEIESAVAVRGWLIAAQGCECETLEDCALF